SGDCSSSVRIFFFSASGSGRMGRSGPATLIPHRIAADGGAIGLGVVFEVLREVDEEGSFGVEGAFEGFEGALLVEGVELFEGLRAVELADVEAVAGAVEGRVAGFGPDEDAGVAVGTADAADGDVGGVAEEVGALVAALEGGTVEIADWLLDEGTSLAVV